MSGSAAPHTSEQEELAALYALDLLDESELTTFERHLAGCDRCETLVEQDRRTAARLSAAAPELAPSAMFKERLLLRAQAGAEVEEAAAGSPAAYRGSPGPTAPPPRQPIRLARRAWAPLRPSTWWLAPLAAVLVVVLGLGAALGQRWYAQQELVAVALAEVGGAVPGGARVVVHRSGTAELRLEGLPAPPPGTVYEGWVIPPSGQPIPAGTAASGTDAIRLEGPVLGRTVAVTLEPAPGIPAPTSNPLLAGTVGG